MFDSLLIANRGEIAVRIARTARRMGVRTVAVFSDADATAAHVAACDAAVRLGPPPAAESYLRGDAVIAAALATGAQAIHPGYGFLSENPEFAQAVLDAGLVWVGPPPEAIRAMGLKDAAKARMQAAGVPVVPGYHGERQEPDFLAGEAEAIGWPVLIKARAGGGGKGMRLVHGPAEFADALTSARREAAGAFGDDRVLVEKFVSRPRHVEVQVFGDGHGAAVHLFERDCSLQRRHQKVVEEAPAPGMSAEMREAMGAAAVRAAKAVGYSGAGTVEFIADASDGLRPDRFFFMEMNTRLQVEHPVTEAVTGLDLVELQLRVAAGEPLPMTQADLRLTGHAFEVRLYAEDPARGFLPQTGRLTRLSLPQDVARVDAGVREGDAVSPHYDPMIAKLIVHGPDRASALGRLRTALAAAEVAGVPTNLDFLRAIAAHAGFAAGDFDTGLIERDLEALTAALPPAPHEAVLGAVALLGLHAPGGAGWAARDGWRLWGPERRPMELSGPEGAVALRLEIRGEGRFAAEIEGGPVEVALTRLPGGLRASVSDGPSLPVSLVPEPGGGATVILGGRATRWALPDPAAAAGAAASDQVVSPMPGLVRALTTAPGAEVKAGDGLMVLEAMKMEHRLTAPRDGVVAEVLCEEGAQVSEGAVLIRLAPVEEAAA